MVLRADLEAVEKEKESLALAENWTPVVQQVARRFIDWSAPPQDWIYATREEGNEWRMPSSGVWRRVDVVDWTDVSEDRIASIFRVEKIRERKTSVSR
jgi:hypothetical protein